MKKTKSILWAIILLCLCILAWASVFIWHNLYIAIMFTAGIFIWLWSVEAKQNN